MQEAEENKVTQILFKVLFITELDESADTVDYHLYRTARRTIVMHIGNLMVLFTWVSSQSFFSKSWKAIYLQLKSSGLLAVELGVG